MPRPSTYRRSESPEPLFADEKPLRERIGKMHDVDASEYDDVDIETLLGRLTNDELEELNNDYDPDNTMLPPSERCRDQTTKAPTGKYNRSHLVEYLEEEAKKDNDWEERVPYVPGELRGKEFQPKIRQASDEPEEAAIELDIERDDDRDDIDEAMEDPDEADLVDLAGLLGMHSMLSQPQFYNANRGLPQDAKTGTTFKGVVPAYVPKLLPDEAPNSTDVEDTIKKLLLGDNSIVNVNINNMKHISRERIAMLISAAKDSKSIESLQLCNTAITDREAEGLIDLIAENDSIRNISIESNFLSPELLTKLLRAAVKQQKLVELHAENQRTTVLGNQIEMEMMQAIEESDSLLRVGIAFDSMEARHRVGEALERNYERLRLQRMNRSTST